MELILNLLLFLSVLPITHCSCDTPDRYLLTLAFSSVSNFPLPPPFPNVNCPKIHELRLPSRNLSGTVSWMFLRNISTLRAIDLSNNSLEGSIPGGFWSAPSLAEVNLAHNRLGGTLRLEPGPLRVLNLSSNRFTNAIGISGFAGLHLLDLSRNNLSFIPFGLENLRALKYFDVSFNSMAGNFSGDFPILPALRFLNVSFNNLTGKVDSRNLKKFGSSAFIKAGSLTFTSSSSSSSSYTHKKQHKPKSRRRVLKLGFIVAVSVIIGLALFAVVFLFVRRRKGWKDGWKEEEKGVAAVKEELGWVAEARWGAPVVVFEKPLMELTFSDLATATSGFGRESQLAEGGRSGPIYRAVLPSDMNLVVRVMESAREVEEKEAAASFRELARLRHPNLLPLIGYCITGREKLLLYEYMARGDLHQWLHELPAGKPDVEDCSADSWEPHHSEDKRTTAVAGDWPARHRIALGIARGLAFLHQGWVGSRRPVVHGHLVPSNILLGEDLEPRIADFAVGSTKEGETAEGDVYSYGVLVMELVTGRAGWSGEEVERVRRLVRQGKGAEVVDPRLRVGEGGGLEWEREMVESLRVGYLCAAQTPEKRPTMQQVVGLLKDIRPLFAAAASSPTTATTTSSSR